MISIIVALAKNNVIGKGNDLPWHYPEDLAYFRKMTLHKTVLMGEATFQSIVNRLHKPLPNRKNIVASTRCDFDYPGVECVRDLISYLKKHQNEDIFIIGGKQIYELSLPYAKRLYITHINQTYDGDVFFPEIDYRQFQQISKADCGDLSFCVYEKVI